MSRGRTNLFPLKASRHGGENDLPPTKPVYGLFDASGFWANLAGIVFQRPADERESAILVNTVAKMCNAAYEQGREDALRAVREALGVES